MSKPSQRASRHNEQAVTTSKPSQRASRHNEQAVTTSKPSQRASRDKRASSPNEHRGKRANRHTKRPRMPRQQRAATPPGTKQARHLRLGNCEGLRLRSRATNVLDNASSPKRALHAHTTPAQRMKHKSASRRWNVANPTNRGQNRLWMCIAAHPRRLVVLVPHHDLRRSSWLAIRMPSPSRQSPCPVAAAAAGSRASHHQPPKRPRVIAFTRSERTLLGAVLPVSSPVGRTAVR